MINRRAFLRAGSLVVLAAESPLCRTRPLWGDETDEEVDRAATETARVKIGLVTDLHYADIPSAGSRHYRQSLTKLKEAAGEFARYRPDLVVELGDLIDAADSVEGELGHLAAVQREFVELPGEKHYVLGNHCIYTLTKPEFLEGIGRERSYYSFDRDDFHFVVLDACFREDGQPYGRKNNHWTDSAIPPAELRWLEDDLAATDKKCVVFTHQRLDETRSHSVRNRAKVREVLERSGRVLAVLQGHSHQNDYQEIRGIHYCTLVAMVEGSGDENNAFATLDVLADGALRLNGFRKQKDYRWS